MIARHNLAVVDLFRVNIPQKESLAVLPLHIELLIKIAIVNLTTPADADGIAAHKTANGRRIKRFNEELHIFVELVVMPQINSEAPDREIRDRVKVIEDNSEMRRQFAFVIGLQFRLWRWQKRPHRIVNEMQRQFCFDAVA